MRCLEQLLHLNLKKNRAFIALFFLLISNILEAKIVIDLYPIVKIKKENILLKDISKIDSNQKRLKNFIGEIFIRKIDKDIIKIEKKEILKKLKENYIDLKEIKFIGADKVIVKRETIKITQEDIIKDIERFLKREYKDYIDIVSISLSKKEYVFLAGDIDKKIRYRTKSSNSIYLNYEIFIDGKKTKSIPVTVKVIHYKMVPFAKRDIPKGKKIASDDIYFKRAASKRYKDNLSKKDIVGKVAKRDIKKDSIIKSFLLLPDYVVLKRKNVKILYQNGAINIELIGLALENGKIGDIIKVKNISSNKVIKCKVIAPFVVKFIK